jgi:excisionase family DNA binding protein
MPHLYRDPITGSELYLVNPILGVEELPDYITTEEAAEISGLHVNYIRKLARAGKIRADKKGVWLIYREDLLRYIDEMKALGTDKHNWRRAQDGD